MKCIVFTAAVQRKCSMFSATAVQMNCIVFSPREESYEIVFVNPMCAEP